MASYSSLSMSIGHSMALSSLLGYHHLLFIFGQIPISSTLLSIKQNRDINGRELLSLGEVKGKKLRCL